MKVQFIGVGHSIRHNGEGHSHMVVQVESRGNIVIITTLCPKKDISNNGLFTYTYHWDDEVAITSS